MAEFQVVKYKHGKTTFEVLTSMGSVLKFRDGKIGNIQNTLVSEEVAFTTSLLLDYPFIFIY